MESSIFFELMKGVRLGSNKLVADKIMVKNIDELLRYVVKTNTMVAITGDAKSGKSTLAKHLVSFLPDAYKINVIGTALGEQISKDYSDKNIKVMSLNILDDNAEQLLELAADATVIDEVIEADDFGSLMNIGLQDDCGTVIFVHPANNTENLIKSFRNCLMKACGFADKTATDKFILEALKLNIHVAKINNKFVIERITEIVGREDGEHDIHNIAEYDAATDSYKTSKMSAHLYDSICTKLTAVEKAELDKLF